MGQYLSQHWHGPAPQSKPWGDYTFLDLSQLYARAQKALRKLAIYSDHVCWLGAGLSNRHWGAACLEGVSAKMKADCLGLRGGILETTCTEVICWVDYLCRARCLASLTIYIWHQHQLWQPMYVFAAAAREASD